MIGRVRLTHYWLAAALAAAGLGVLVNRSPRAALAALILLALVAAGSQVMRLPATMIFAGSVVLSSALVDLPGRVQPGRFTVNAGLTVAYAFVGAVTLALSPTAAMRETTRLLRPFVGLLILALVSLAWGTPSIAGIQTILVLFVFIASVFWGIRVSSSESSPGRFAGKVFGLGSIVALVLYAGSLVQGGLGGGAVIGNRSFALFALFGVAWGAAGWRYGARFGRPLALVSGLFILLSLSRIAFAAALIMLCLAWLNPRTFGGWVRFVIGVAATLGVGYLAIKEIAPLHDRFYSGDVKPIGGGFSVNVEGRSEVWSTTWHSYLTSPWIGHGVGSADNLITHVYSAAVGHPHNDYLRLLHDYGLLGACLWAIGYASLLTRTWRSWHAARVSRTADSSPESRVHAAAFLALIGVAVAMVTDNAIVYLHVMGPLGVLVGLSLGLSLRSVGGVGAASPAAPLAHAPAAAYAHVPGAKSAQTSLAPILHDVDREPPRISLPIESASSRESPTVAVPAIAPRKLFGGFSLNLAGGIISALMALAFTILIARILPPAGVGIFFQAIAVFSILLVVTQFGASATVVKSVSEYRALGRTPDIPRGIVVSLLPAAVLSLAAAIGIVLFASPLADALVKGGNRHDAVLYLRILAPFVPLASLLAILLGATRALGTMTPTVFLDSIGKPSLRLVCVAAVSAVTLSPLALGAAWGAPLALALAIVSVTVARLVRRTQRLERRAELRPRPFGVLAREIYGLTAPQWLADAFQLAVLWIDVLLVGALASSREAGIYGAVSRLVMVGSLGLAALVLVLGPVLSALLARDQLQHARLAYRMTTVWLSAAIVPVFLLMATFAPLIVRIFGAEFGPGARALTILSLAMSVEVMAGPTLLTLLMGGRSRVILAISAVGFAVNLGLNVILIPRWGMTGAAIAWTSSIALVNLLALGRIRRLWGINPFDGTFVIVVASAAICYGGGGFVGTHLAGQTVAALVVTAALATMFYGAALWSLRARLAPRAAIEPVTARVR